MDAKKEPESFSLDSAMEAAEAMFEALPRAMKGMYLDELNEILVVLGRVKCEDRAGEYRG